MKLYNTLTKQVEEIVPQKPPTVTVYTCGPTVYDYPHIGNWFTFIRYDLLIRALKLSDLKPTWVINITDVGHLVSDQDEGEDKLVKAANREGKTAWDIASFYANYFIKGLKKLNITDPEYLPRATDHITEQIELIKTLEKKGYTYTIDDGVYYDTSKFPEYSKFAGLDVDEQQAGKRVELNPQKKNDTDFALWKFSPKDKKRDMEWDSPWGKGFPGWHIECSAMAIKYLGETIDIHAGGIEHLPVHHTNEIAQSQAATGKIFAKYWMHMNHILIDGTKISKSLGNTLTLEDIEKLKVSLDAFRLLVLQSHYRSQSHYSNEILQTAQTSLNNLIRDFSSQFVPHTSENEDKEKITKLFSKYREKISNEVLDDLNTPAAVALLHECATEYIKLDSQSDDAIIDFSRFINDTLGIKIYQKHKLTDTQLDIFNQRLKARENKDWEKSDQLRDGLSAEGITVTDTDNGSRWWQSGAAD